MMQADAELVQLALDDDREAAAILIRRYESAVFATALSKSRNHHIAEDVTQDVFMTAIGRLASLKDPERFGGWLMTIAKRMAIRASQQQRKKVPLAEADAVAECLINETDAIENFDLMKQIALLPEHEQVVIALKHFQGNSVSEIAAITGRPIGTVTKQLSRAYSHLREQVAEIES